MLSVSSSAGIVSESSSVTPASFRNGPHEAVKGFVVSEIGRGAHDLAEDILRKVFGVVVVCGACAAEVQDRFGNFRDLLVSFFVCHVFVPFMKVYWSRTTSVLKLLPL